MGYMSDLNIELTEKGIMDPSVQQTVLNEYLKQYRAATATGERFTLSIGDLAARYLRTQGRSA